jgi:hypothetical protein
MKSCIWVRFRLSAETGCTPGMSSNGSRNTARLGASLQEAGPVCLPFSRSRAQVDQLNISTNSTGDPGDALECHSHRRSRHFDVDDERSIDRRFPLVSAPPSEPFDCSRGHRNPFHNNRHRGMEDWNDESVASGISNPGHRRIHS